MALEGDVCGIAALAWPVEKVVLPGGTVQFALKLDAQLVWILTTHETEWLAVGYTVHVVVPTEASAPRH